MEQIQGRGQAGHRLLKVLRGGHTGQIRIEGILQAGNLSRGLNDLQENFTLLVKFNLLEPAHLGLLQHGLMDGGPEGRMLGGHVVSGRGQLARHLRATLGNGRGEGGLQLSLLARNEFDPFLLAGFQTRMPDLRLPLGESIRGRDHTFGHPPQDVQVGSGMIDVKIKAVSQFPGGPIVDLGQKPFFHAIDRILPQNQDHRQAERDGRRVEGDRQPRGDELCIEGLRVKAGHGQRDPDHGAQESQNWNRPNTNPHQGISIVRSTRVNVGQAIEFTVQALRVAAAEHVFECLPQPATEKTRPPVAGQFLERVDEQLRRFDGRAIRADGLEHRAPHLTRLFSHVDRLQDQVRQRDEEQDHFQIRDPMPGEIIQHKGRI